MNLEKAQEILRLREAVITDPDVSPDDKARAVMDAAGDVLMQTIEEDRKEARQQYDEVYDHYHNADGKPLDGWLKTPNGKDTNLSEHQWVQVRTPAFKAWFGDWINDPDKASKIVDDNGEPSLVFHGTRTEFEAFSLEKAGTRRDPGMLGKGFYFSTDKYAASAGDPITLTLFANAKNPLYVKMDKWSQGKSEIVSKALGLENTKDSTEIRNKVIQSGYDAVVLDYSPLGYKHQEIMMLNPEQIKSATNNTGAFDTVNPSILFQTASDDAYFKALEATDMETAQRIVDSEARKKGYVSTDEYRMQHSAPDRESYNAAGLMDSGIVPDDYWTHPQYYQYDADEKFSFYTIKLAIERYKETGKSRLWVYRSVPKNIKEGEIRNGDWISPSRDYAEIEGKGIPGGYRIIAERVNLADLWWDGNSINEFGYDDGKNYVYKNTKNNRKLNDIIVRDYDGNIVPPSKRFNYRAFEIFYQTGDRDMMEEAAEFENGKEYRAYVEFMYDGSIPGYEIETAGLSDAALNAWYDEFVKKAKLAAKSGEQGGEISAGGKLTPAEVDREFNELIGEPGKLDEFVKRLADTHNENYDNWQAVDEEDAAERDRQMEYTGTLRRYLTHPTWQSIFKANGDIGPIQRKQLLTLIRKAPREYRAMYADVMERPEFAVSAEDTTAEILKHRISDSRREDIDSLSPEKLRQLAEQLDIEDYAEKVRTGRALYNDPAERAYIKQLQGQIKEVEQALKEVEADRQEDNEYLERIAGNQFIDTFNRAVEAHEEIRRSKDNVDKAIATQKKNAAVFVRKAQRATVNYNSIVQNLESLAKAQKLEMDVRDTLENQQIHDAVQAARKELKTESREKIDALKDEVKKVREQERTKASLQKKFAVIMAVKELKAYQEDLKERQENQKAHTLAKNAVVKRIFRPVNPREVNAEQGRAAAIIQRFAEPSMLEGIDRFIGGIEKPYLRTIFETWKIDEILRDGIVKGKTRATREKMTRLFSKENFDQLTGEEKKYLYRVIPPKDWATALGLESIIGRRNENYPTMNGQVEQQIAFNYLPPDVYYRIMDKPFSEWTLEEGEELAKIIDDLIVRGKEIYKANIDAERRRIKEYQRAVVRTIGTITKRGLQESPDDSPEERARKKTEREKILNKFNEGIGVTAQAQARRRKFKGPFLGYADMPMRILARMLDNGDTNGKNSAALYRRASDAYNMKMVAIDTRTEKIEKIMNEQKITKTELWEKTIDIDLGGYLGKTTFTAAELIGFLSATRDEYSREAVIYGNLLSEQERGFYQYDGITAAELAPLYELAEGRFEQVKKAAEQLMADAPKYRQLMDAIDADFTEGGQRLSESLIRYNNSYMPIVDKYFPINRQAPVTVQSADAQYARDLMGASTGAFNLFVEKGFTNKRQAIPAQYQTAINLDILGVWTDAVSREEHFMAYGQMVKDLNAVYKGNRQVRDIIQRRYGQSAVDYINKYINELANPNQERVRTSLDKAIKAMRGNTAAAYLGWKVSSIVKQFITSPAPFFSYMNPLEYWGTFVEYTTHREESWKEITELSEHMKHRSANLLTDLVKEQAKQRFENKVDAAISKINERGIQGLEWIDRMCVAPGWMALYRKEFRRLTSGTAGGTLTERDAKVKAAQYADDIIRATQPSARPEDIAPLFKGNSELGKAFLQFTQSLNIIWQNVRYDVPQMIRERRYSNAAGMVMGYVIAGIMLGAITEGFGDDDDDEKAKVLKIARWSTLQFTDAFPIIGSEATHLTEILITGKAKYQSGLNLVPAIQKMWYAAESGIRGGREEDFNKLLKAVATAAEGAAIFKGLPVSGIKEAGLILGIGGDGEPHPESAVGRR
jgi:hypothetical protein